MLAGVLKPVILLPASLLTGLRRSDVEAILAHELAHFARWDSWTNLFQIFVETILFYHPAIWWISNRARIERENAADDLAIRALREDRLSYAQALARLAELEHDAQALAIAANDGSIVARLRRVVRAREETEPADAGWLVAGVIALLCLTFVPLHAQENRNVVKVNAGEPLQAAIDAAAPGSIIQLGEGEWKERIVITKPLTLEGAGWEKTIIKPDQPPPGATAEAKAEFRKQYFGHPPRRSRTGSCRSSP
jgi:beta-lactamase regulating signal transducer with metallopeptidase domain